jgi:hypothetical protein
VGRALPDTAGASLGHATPHLLKQVAEHVRGGLSKSDGSILHTCCPIAAGSGSTARVISERRKPYRHLLLAQLPSSPDTIGIPPKPARNAGVAHYHEGRTTLLSLQRPPLFPPGAAVAHLLPQQIRQHSLIRPDTVIQKVARLEEQ